MPLTLTLIPAPLITHASTTPLWKRIHRIADALLPSFQGLWRTLFGDLRDSLATEPMQEALTTRNPLLIENVLAQAWHDEGTTVAARLLPPLVGDAVDQVARAVTPHTAQLLGVLLPRFDLSNPAATAWIDQYAGTQIRSISDETLMAVRQILRTGQTEGRTVAQMGRDLRAVVGLNTRQATAVENLRQRLTAQGLPEAQVTRQVQRAADKALRQRAETIARTETITSANAGQQELWKQAAAQGHLQTTRFRRYWLVTEGTACETICEPIPGMNPDGVALDEPFNTPVGPLMFPTAHPRCLLGDTLVTGCSRVEAVSKRIYQGDILVMFTSSGKELACTPNHPILTTQGWMQAEMLRQSDDIICSIGQQGIAPGDDDIATVPMMIKEIAETLLCACQVATAKVPVSAEDFHGDGGGSEIAVIGTNRQLRNSLQPSFGQHFLHKRFKGRTASSALPAQSLFLLQGQREGFPTHRIMCRLCLSSACIGRHLLPFQSLSLTLIPSYDVRLVEQARYHTAAHTLTICQGLLRYTGGIVVEQLREIRRYPFRGHVFNLQTRDGWYSGNGIITHNCRCSVNGALST